MRSLVCRLSAGLLAGLGLVWLLTGGVVVTTVRQSLEGRFDAELQAMASEVRYLLPEGRGLQEDQPSAYWFDFYRPDSGLYFEVWDEFLLFSDRSASLGVRELPRPPGFEETPRFWNATLATGERVRIIAQRLTSFSPGGDSAARGSYPLHVVVARNRNALDRSLRFLLGATGLAGLFLVPVMLLVVRVAVGRGLRPLRGFAERVAAIDIDSLQERFPLTGVPAELQPVAERLNELMKRLAAGIERERRLTSDLAHELRTPVAELKTMAEVALAWPDRQVPGGFREVLDAANHMQALIDRMLMLARWERNASRPPAETVDVAAVVMKAWQAQAKPARDRQLNAVFNLAPGATVVTNPDLFLTIVANLLANAVEYSPAGGALRIESSADSAGPVFQVANSSGDLAEADLPHLFERFWRKDSARRENGHAGLGLPLAKSCADILGLVLAAELDASAGQIVFRLSSPAGK